LPNGTRGKTLLETVAAGRGDESFKVQDSISRTPYAERALHFIVFTSTTLKNSILRPAGPRLPDCWRSAVLKVPLDASLPVSFTVNVRVSCDPATAIPRLGHIGIERKRAID
jgi:hypothetical protein